MDQGNNLYRQDIHVCLDKPAYCVRIVVELAPGGSATTGATPSSFHAGQMVPVGPDIFLSGLRIITEY